MCLRSRSWQCSKRDNTKGSQPDLKGNWSAMISQTYSIIFNPLILPNTGHAGDLGDAQTPVQGVPGGHHALTCLGISLQKVVTPQPVRGGSSSPRGPRRSSRLNLPRDPISRRLSCLSLPGDLHPGLGTPGSQVATFLGRISFRKTHP